MLLKVEIRFKIKQLQQLVNLHWIVPNSFCPRLRRQRSFSHSWVGEIASWATSGQRFSIFMSSQVPNLFDLGLRLGSSISWSLGTSVSITTDSVRHLKTITDETDKCQQTFYQWKTLPVLRYEHTTFRPSSLALASDPSLCLSWPFPGIHSWLLTSSKYSGESLLRVVASKLLWHE